MSGLDAPSGLDGPSGLDSGSGVITFTPPTVADMGPINPDTQGQQRRLFGYYQPHKRGINVWKLPDGTYTQEQPYPLVTPEDARMGNLPQGQATVVTYVLVYYGGHVYEVDSHEAAALRAAGYGSNLA